MSAANDSFKVRGAPHHLAPSRRKHREQGGYALVLVVFLTTLMLISVMAIAPSIRTEKQREKEQEMIWRGKQYVRGIKLFYRKNGRFPTSMDDLTKPKMGSLRFMRKAYKDPMNTTDGSWRLIYVGPAGQLIGSLKPQHQTFQMPGVAGATPAGAVGQKPLTSSQSGFGASSSGTSGFSSGFGQSGSQPGSQASTQTGGSQNTQNANGGSTTQNNAGATDDAGALPASASGTLNDSPIMGGNIVGVGSKMNKRSVIVYEQAKNYRLFEFIWNPSKDMMNALGVQGGAAIQPGAAGQQRQGQGTGTGTPPPQGSPASMPEPPPPPQPQP